MSSIRIGVAGWSIHAYSATRFPDTGSHLARYAATFDAVEINSSFYREHRVTTYERWAGSVPDTFRFSAKIPKAITHEQRLAQSEALLDRFLPGPAALGARLGPLIVQLPPSLQLDPAVADGFFAAFRIRWSGPIVCEPRHASWFTEAGEEILTRHRIGRVAADPVRAPGADQPGGWPDTVYYRLHGSPRTYYSAYPAEYLEAVAGRLAAAPASERWCILDNTALGAAAHDAVTLRGYLDGTEGGPASPPS